MASQNTHQLAFIQSMFTGVKHKESIAVHVNELHDNIPYTIEVSNNTDGNFLVYRINHQGEEGTWSSWESPDDVEKFFKTASFI